MLERVFVGRSDIADYESTASAETVAELRALAEPLRGARVLHVNATPYGGGVAELLRSFIPLLRGLGIDADWQLIRGNAHFFSITKTIHNGLQGDDARLDADEWKEYRRLSQGNGEMLDTDHDVIVIHDPQPLAIRRWACASRARWIWRCHIDTAAPNHDIWSSLRPFLEGYDAAVFTMADFVPPDLGVPEVAIISPAIDPRSPKNLDLGQRLGRELLEWMGIDVHRPLMTQVSRFDRWKDPFGVIEAFRLVREEIPEMQLAMVGSMALDDPEGWRLYRQLQRIAHREPDIRLLTNLTGVGNVEVNAFQRHSDVVLQKSIREGFGLVVSETLWKRTPVVAGRAGGIPSQMPDGVGGFLVDTVEECADRAVWVLGHPDEARAMADRGHDNVRARFLMPRLVADELRLYRTLLGG